MWNKLVVCLEPIVILLEQVSCMPGTNYLTSYMKQVCCLEQINCMFETN
jgi:hypothetical protein